MLVTVAIMLVGLDLMLVSVEIMPVLGLWQLIITSTSIKLSRSWRLNLVLALHNAPAAFPLMVNFSFENF